MKPTKKQADKMKDIYEKRKKAHQLLKYCIDEEEKLLKEFIKINPTKVLTKQEEFAIQQFTGMHYSEGKDVLAVCVGMGLKKDEWKNIKEDCCWLSDYEINEIEEYINR